MCILDKWTRCRRIALDQQAQYITGGRGRCPGPAAAMFDHGRNRIAGAVSGGVTDEHAMIAQSPW